MKRYHYAWVVCIGCTLMLFCTGGLGLTGYVPFLPYLASMKGFTNTQVSSVVFVRTLFGVLGMMLTEPLVVKWNVRRLVGISMVGEAAGFVLYSTNHTFSGFCVASAVVGFTYGLASMIAASILITRWFHERRGLALGICAAATGCSAFLASPLITLVIERFSLNTAFLGEAAFILLSACLVYGMLRDHPSDLGLEPLGEEDRAHVKLQAYASRTAAKHLLILMIVGLLLFGAAANNLSNAISMLFSVAGYPAAAVSMIVSLFGLSLAFGKCVYGYLSDRMGVFKACNILYVAMLAGSAICCFAGKIGYGMAAAGACLVGIGVALASVAVSTYAAEVACEKDYPKIVSIFQTTQTFGGLAFVTVPGVIADMTGSYISAYCLMFLLTLFGALILQGTYVVIKKQNT